MKTLALLVLAQAAAAPTPVPAGLPPTPAELVKTLDATPALKDSAKPFEVAVSLGRLYAGQGRFAEARSYYAQAIARADPVRALLVTLRRALGGRPAPDPAKVGCAPAADAQLEALAARAQEKARAGDAAGAVACATAALAGLPEAEVQYGNTLFILRDAPAALATYGRALETFEGNTGARYARAALLLDTRGDDVPSLKQVKADLERVLKEAPSGPHAPQARRLLERATLAVEKGGLSRLPQVQVAAAPAPAPAPAGPPAMGLPPQQAVQPSTLNPETVKAFETAPRTPELEASFKKLIDEGEDHLAHGRYNEARAAFLQVMPYQPNNGRLRAGMAWSMIRLNRQPMGDNVWRAALEDPDAIAALGDSLKAKGDAEGARAVWQRLADTLPAYAPRLQGKL